MRKKSTNILLLDCGDSFSAEKNVPELRAETSMEGLSLMHYDALNLADGELSLGGEFLEKVKGKALFSLLSANIFKTSENTPLGQAYVVKEFDGFKAGIIGLTSPDFLNQEALEKEGLQVKDPEASLKEILPQVQPKADIIILLSHLGKERTRSLLQAVPGINVAIIGHAPGVMDHEEVMGSVILVQNNLRGQSLGVLHLTLDKNGVVLDRKNRSEKIERVTPSDPGVARLIAQFEAKKAAVDRARMAERRRQELQRKYREGLKMTPEEFIEKVKKEQKLMPQGQLPPPTEDDN